jgi:Family of unknown function (DUF6112)
MDLEGSFLSSSPQQVVNGVAAFGLLLSLLGAAVLWPVLGLVSTLMQGSGTWRWERFLVRALMFFVVGVGIAGVSGRLGVTPDFSELPNVGEIQTVINGLAALTLLLDLIVIILGTYFGAIGSIINNTAMAASGKRAVVFALVGAVTTGASAALVNYIFSLARVL